MHSVDDLGVINPTQIHGGDAEIDMPELALDDGDRDPLARHLNSVGMSELMWGKPTTHAGPDGCRRELLPGRGRRPTLGRRAEHLVAAVAAEQWSRPPCERACFRYRACDPMDRG